MNRIVREHYPVASLPDDLREGLPADTTVRVTLEAVTDPSAPMLSIKELRAARRNNFNSVEDVVAYVRAMRDE